ncbi:hypothetical protein TNCV_4077171 [Trichonephila clavipes]|nr:hypothetical protein TNCV_4077171 [Trichonephila clavipes]
MTIATRISSELATAFRKKNFQAVWRHPVVKSQAAPSEHIAQEDLFVVQPILGFNKIRWSFFSLISQAQPPELLLAPFSSTKNVELVIILPKQGNLIW